MSIDVKGVGYLSGSEMKVKITFQENGVCNKEEDGALQEMKEQEKQDRNELIDDLQQVLESNHQDEIDNQTGDEIRNITHSQAARLRLEKTMTKDLNLLDMSINILNNDWHRRHR